VSSVASSSLAPSIGGADEAVFLPFNGRVLVEKKGVHENETRFLHWSEMPRVRAPLTQNKETVRVTGKTIGEIVENLEEQYPGLKERSCDEHGELRRFVNSYLNDEDIRFAKGKETPVKDGDEISIIPAIAGGCR
jgi:sulfur-carrier protein